MGFVVLQKHVRACVRDLIKVNMRALVGLALVFKTPIALAIFIRVREHVNYV